MSTSNLFTTFLTRYPPGAAILYAGVVMAFAVTAWTTVAEILQRRDAVAATASVLSQLEGRSPAAPRGRGKDADTVTTGSPLLDGGTVAGGGAHLLQRGARSITRLGGDTLYTPLYPRGAQGQGGGFGGGGSAGPPRGAPRCRGRAPPVRGNSVWGAPAKEIVDPGGPAVFFPLAPPAAPRHADLRGSGGGTLGAKTGGARAALDH